MCSHLGRHVACIHEQLWMHSLLETCTHMFWSITCLQGCCQSVFWRAPSLHIFTMMHVSSDCLCIWESTKWAPLAFNTSTGSGVFGPGQDPSFYFLHTGWSKVLHFDEDQITFLFQVRLSVSKTLPPNLGLWGSPPEFRLCTLNFVSLGLVNLQFLR